MASLPITISRRDSFLGRTRRFDDEGHHEEEAEMWAALERLPTFDRMRTTILEREESTRFDRRPVQVKDVDLGHYLMTQIFKLNNPEEDNEKFLSRLRHRMDDVDLEVPTVEVRYEDVKISGQIYQGSRATPTLLNTVLNFFEQITAGIGLSPVKKRNLTILDGVSGTLKPGRMTLLLGPPASGKTTFLLALSGRLDPHLKLEGKIQYNGYTLDEFEPRKTAAYISQDDLHTPELTVRETMDYSARFQGVGVRSDLIRELVLREKERGIHADPTVDYFMKAAASEELSHEVFTQYYMKIMGLDICADTIVGDQMSRGISGGQRKRLTTGEMIVGPSRALFMDEISTGLDSSTTFQVVKCIGQAARIFGTVLVISLLQPAPETYELFDDVILLSSGYIIYQGALEHVEEFFETCGFKCPPRKAIPDFLQEVTSIKDQEQYWADKGKPYKFVPVIEFVDAFKKFHVSQEMKQEMEKPLEKSQGHPKALSFDHWSLSQWALFKINFDKEVLIFRKNLLIPVFNLMMLVLTSSLASSLFFRTEMHHRNLPDAQHYNGALFFILNQVVFLGYSELTFTAIRFPVFHKLRELYFFPPWTWAVSLFLIKIPFAILESFTCLAFTYYIIGFTPQASRFFRLWLVLALADQMGSGLFRMLAGFCRTFVIASSVGGFFLTMIFLLGGYVIPRSSIKKYWIWGYWLDPLSYVQNAVVNNEFLAPRWRKDLPNDKHTLGHRFILSLDLFDRGFFYWMVVGALVAFTLAFYTLFALAITFLGIPGKSPPQISEEQMAEQNAQRTGEGLDPVIKSLSTPRSMSATPKDSTPRLQMTEDPTGASSSRSVPRSDSQNSNKSEKGDTSPGKNGAVTAGPKTGMILPFQPLAISFKNVNYFVDLPSGMPKETSPDGQRTDRLQLLRDITGSFRPGVLTALVGVTGAGKSTLMDVLAGRKTKGYIEGDIRISGHPKKQETFARISGYCEQNDIHSPQVTLHESLIFSAWLRLPREIPSEQKMEFVQQVMDLIELTALKDSIVGSPGESGLSTEQRKRLTIAVELVANPSIIFMDEPTSGLDARAAATVMRTVRNTVDTGRTVVCTIHQPSIDIFDSFDELVLLKRGGQPVYIGPLGKHAHKLIEYFQGINGVPKIREGVNPAAWMLEVTTPGMADKLNVDFAELYKNSSVYEDTNKLVDELSKPPPNMQDLSFPSKYAQPLWYQFTCCLWKQNWAYWRTPSYNVMRIGLSLAIGLLAGSVFWGMGKRLTSQQNVYSLLGAIYSSQIFFGVLMATAVQPLIAAERTIFYRERSAGMFSELPYALAQCAVEVPYVIVATGLFAIISFSMIKLDWDVKKFFWYYYFSFCSQLTFVYWGMMTIAITSNPQFAAIIAGVFYNIWNLFSGFMVGHPLFPQWWRWIYWVNPLSYHIYGVIVSQFGDLSNSYATTQTGELLSVKQMIRTSYGYKHNFLWFVGCMSIGFPFIFALLFVVAIKYLNFQQR